MTTENVPVPKPVPVPDELSGPFFVGAKDHRLMVQRCSDCDTFQGPGRFVCDNCLSDHLTWVQASGKGTVFSFVIMHQRYHPGFAAEIPYNIATVELEEGPRLLTILINIANDDIRVGLPVKVKFEDINQDISLPKFEPSPA